MSRPLRVLHLTGSPTSDFFADLSRLYAADCLAAVAEPGRYEPVIADVSPDGTWRFPASLSAEDLAAEAPMSVGAALERLTAGGFDVALPQLFCIPGMTHYRSLLDVLGIPYIGNRPDVMALGAHKARAKAVVAAAGVRVPAGVSVPGGEQEFHGRLRGLALPVVVKPVDGDNSEGVTLVRSAAEYPAALSAAWQHSAAALVEQFVPLGREVRCGIIVRDGELVCLPLEEYGLPDAPIRTAADKIRRGADGALGLMAKDNPTVWILDPDDPVTAAVWAAARACHQALGCQDYSLFDFRVDPDGQPWFLEAGLYNSFARQSVIPTMARAIGLELPELLAVAVAERIGAGGPR